MINEPIEITRGEGPFEHVFDFSNSMPPRQINDNDQWLLRIEDSLISIYTKRSNKAGGSDEEILLSEGADTVTIILTEEERTAIPDDGYTYRLFLVNTFGEWEVAAHGDVTNEGDPPAESEVAPTKITASNAGNRRSVSQDFNFHALDDYVYADTSVDIIGTLPNANAFGSVKRYVVKNKGANTLRINDHQEEEVIRLAEDESCEVASNGTGWEALFTGVEPL